MPFETLKPTAATNGQTSTFKNLNGAEKPSVNGDSSHSNISNTNGSLNLDSLKQSLLRIHEAAKPYTLEKDQAVPEVKSDNELLVQVLTIGLNPVDWKGVDYDFSQPEYPWINGRDFAGVVVKAPRNSNSRIQEGDVVCGPSTDYRDTRKATFQEYVVASDYNVTRIPKNVDVNVAASLGVAFSAAVITLGVCLGIDFTNVSNAPKGPNLLAELRKLKQEEIPEDTQREVYAGILPEDMPRQGEWILIWGCGVVGQVFIQLARFAGLRTACVEDLAATGEQLVKINPDFMIDYKGDQQRVVEILKSVTGGKLRFGIDTVGKKTGESLQQVLQQQSIGQKSHIAGFSGVPDSCPEGVVQHKALPIKLFHEVPAVGESISKWLEDLLVADALHLPGVDTVDGGLAAVNDGLDRLRSGKIVGRRVVVPIRTEDGTVL